MSAIKKGKIDWKTVKTGKKQERENDGTAFSMHLAGSRGSRAADSVIRGGGGVFKRFYTLLRRLLPVLASI